MADCFSRFGFVFAISVGTAVTCACTSTVVREVGEHSGGATGKAGASANSLAPAQGGNTVPESSTATQTEETTSGGSSSTLPNTTARGGTSALRSSEQGGESSGGTSATSSDSGTQASQGGTSATSSGSGTQTNQGGATTVARGGSSTTGGSSTGSTSLGGRSSTGGTVSASTVGLGGCNLSKPFGAWQQILPGTANSSEHSLSVTEDGLSALVAVRSKVTDPTSSYDLKRYSRTSLTGTFGSEMNILGSENVNTAANEYQPRLSRDGLTLFFTRSSTAGTAIYWATRSAVVAFPVPTAMGAPINLAADTGGPFLASDASYFYWIAAAQVYRAEVASGYQTTLLLANVSSVGSCSAVVVTDDQLTLYVSSKGKDASAFTYDQVWRATRPTSSSLWTVPTVIEELRDASQHTYVQDVSPDGCILYAAKTSSSVYRLYQSSRPR